MSNDREMQKKSSATTLSDMEMFIFPELIYSLVLANIMSPRIWKWRLDPWFDGMERMSTRRRINRLRQYIMDHYVFNLDLDTWGLTTKDIEIGRFKDFIDPTTLAQANALFGYEGDKYYFDMDIRTHFGLDKYEGNIIPYWKTETVEAMDAFKHRPNYMIGAGECVSLSCLYAAALFVVARVPLKDIYLMATPLHSQNFIDIDDGVLTNNRRLVTKSMWFNGTAISGQARRALENERVTIVAHETGIIHTIYDRATIDRRVYDHFAGRLKRYLRADFTDELLGNFLRHDHSVQKCFQVRRPLHGVDQYIGMERVLEYEHGSPYMFSDNTRDKLMAEIENSEFRPAPFKSRIVLNDLESFVKSNNIDINDPVDLARLKEQFVCDCMSADIAIESLCRFCRVEPKLPDADSKEFVHDQEPLNIDGEMTREEIMDRLESIRGGNDMADMSFYAYRDLTRVEPEPFLKACMERNPVSLSAMKDMNTEDIIANVSNMENESIYDEDGRLAQPDEVWNYRRGDGLEKAVLLANIFRRREGGNISIELTEKQAILSAGTRVVEFASSKNLAPAKWDLS